MTIIRRSGPFGDLVSLRSAMDRLFEESFINPRTWNWGENGLVPMDVYVTDNEFVLEASLPGVKPEAVDITVEGNTLTISGEITASTTQQEGATILNEIRRGQFTRTMTLPAGMEPDKAKATFEDGVLKLVIPKAEQAKPRQIKVNAGSAADGQPARIEAK
jgi:HSP20 family protein